MKITPTRLGLKSKLSNPRVRERFIATLARDEIASQIRALRMKRGYTTQTEFAKAAKMQQSAVSRIEQAGYSGWSFKTLLRIAVLLKARLRVTFEPLETVVTQVQESERLADVMGRDDTSRILSGSATGATRSLALGEEEMVLARKALVASTTGGVVLHGDTGNV